MQRYLYGASVQGIQNFIFQTNQLKEIAGASEIVEQICTNEFRAVANIDAKDPNIILNAAGNIKYIFNQKADCERFVRIFPKVVMEMAQGITISQAVVAVGDQLTNADMQSLEQQLRVQRNKIVQIPSANLMVSEIARKTGGAAIKFDYDGDSKMAIDLAQVQKRKMADASTKNLLNKIVGQEDFLLKKFPIEMTDIASNDSNNWIAVVHADGNNLGQKIIAMVNTLEAHKIQKAMRELSDILNDSTIKAAKKAFERVIDAKMETKFPFRPVILGGDDLTVIIRGDLAIEFTKVFLEQFEIITKHNFNDFKDKYQLKYDLFGKGLTACAGIAFIKATYPFHYGVKLADYLCHEAKKVSKKLISPSENDDKDKQAMQNTPSSLVFHKVHASFVESYEEIIKKELTAKDNVQFNYGPYFIHKQDHYLTIDALQKWVEDMNRKDAPKAGLRSWLTELRNNPEKADQLLQRIRSLNSKFEARFNLNQPFTQRADGKKYAPIFDIISLSNLQK
jgi:hypothetical protein